MPLVSLELIKENRGYSLYVYQTCPNCCDNCSNPLVDKCGNSMQNQCVLSRVDGKVRHYRPATLLEPVITTPEGVYDLDPICKSKPASKGSLNAQSENHRPSKRFATSFRE